MVICDALLEHIGSFLENRFPRVVLNGQASEWLPVKQVFHKDLFQGLSFFLIYINDLSIDTIFTVKLSAGDTSLFSIIHVAKATGYELSRDLQKIPEWAHQWKMSFNPGLNKQAQEIIFQGK